MSVYFFIFKCYLFVLFTGKCCIKCCQTNGARCPWVSPMAFYFFNGDKRFSLTFLPHWVSADEHAQMDLKSLCMCHCTCISRSVGEINIKNRVDQEQACLSSTVCLIFPNFFFYSQNSVASSWQAFRWEQLSLQNSTERFSVHVFTLLLLLLLLSLYCSLIVCFYFY